MKKRKSVFYIIIALFLLLQLYSLSRINRLENHISNLENSIISYQNSLSRMNGDISENVKNILDRQASIIASCSYEIGTPDMETLTIPISFRVQPKQLTDSTSVSLRFEDDTLAMERNGSEFFLTHNFELSNVLAPTIIVEDNGVSQFEENRNLFVYGLRSYVFPETYPNFNGSRGYMSRRPEYEISGTIYMDNYSPEVAANGMNILEEAKYVIAVDGQVVSEKEIDLKSSDIVFGVDIKEKCKVEQGQTVSLNIIAVDSLGFTHEYPLINYTNGGEDNPVYGEKITAPDGRVVWDDMDSSR